MQTVGTEKFKVFLTQPFDFNQLFVLNGNCQVLFDGWKGKNMGSWIRYTHDDDYMLEIFPKHYIIRQSKNIAGYQMPIPKTINDFINHMEMFGIQLYWNNWIDENFEPKDYLNANEISTYFTNLLIRMKKEQDID